MFTGIVAEVGTVTEVAATGRGRRFLITADLAADLTVGSSVAVNGVCLTAISVDAPRFGVEAVAETLARTNLGNVVPGDGVDLELPMAVGSRFDGHIVQGHVDATGVVTSMIAEGDAVRMQVRVPANLARYMVHKGSVAVDGVALTLTAASAGSFEFVLIPHTLQATVLGTRGEGDTVNVEVDVLAKYVERMVAER